MTMALDTLTSRRTAAFAPGVPRSNIGLRSANRPQSWAGKDDALKPASGFGGRIASVSDANGRCSPTLRENQETGT